MTGFALAILPLVITPGASLTLLIRHVTEDGRRRAVPVVLGTVTGLYTHAALAVAGLSALVMGSETAFTVVRVAGACYLIGLGAWTWWSAGRSRRPAGRGQRWRSAYPQALFANLLNPKAASVFLTLIPQFLTSGRPLAGQILALATVQIVMVSLWLTAWALLLPRTAARPGGERFRRTIGRIAGAMLIGLGGWGLISG
ncbi:LysE family translocator [Streptomyces sp. XM4011]|uniref:LysE family translocator n=1 Tax=Streptomyces sp. XM4011 TaxID=2929780 RepID=UPI001FFB2670|nr:LysE family translocator [Streptomyces sp. XM4011]MCK1814288.1 LysE family translocator [Streptomyces sp. XM4011]